MSESTPEELIRWIRQFLDAEYDVCLSAAVQDRASYDAAIAVLRDNYLAPGVEWTDIAFTSWRGNVEIVEGGPRNLFLIRSYRLEDGQEIHRVSLGAYVVSPHGDRIANELLVTGPKYQIVENLVECSCNLTGQEGDWICRDCGGRAWIFHRRDIVTFGPPVAVWRGMRPTRPYELVYWEQDDELAWIRGDAPDPNPYV